MAPAQNEVTERAEVRSWAFPSEKMQVRWLPRSGCFKVLMDTDEGYFLQTVPAKGKALPARLIKSLDSGQSPRMSGIWPVTVAAVNAIPADKDWRFCRFACLIVPSDGGRHISARYHVSPDDAVMDAMDMWASLDGRDRSDFTVIACEVAPDFPISLTYSTIWMPEEGCGCGAWTGTLPVMQSGNSLVVRITAACSALGVSPGEEIDVSIRRRGPSLEQF